VGAAAVSAAVAASIPSQVHGSTFGGNPLACAGALAVLGLLTADLLAEIDRLGERFLARLRQALPAACAVRGRGLMAGVAAGPRRDDVLKALQRAGILAIPAGTDVVRFLPPYVVAPDELSSRAVEVLAEATLHGR
jgi:acetylornithine/LysW-gamma-L-lysine aminotransferase